MTKAQNATKKGIHDDDNVDPKKLDPIIDKVQKEIIKIHSATPNNTRKPDPIVPYK